MPHRNFRNSLAATVTAAALAAAGAASGETIDINGVEIVYDIQGEAGDAPALLLLHGSYGAARDMTAFTQGFVGNRQVIVPDQRGHGRSGFDDTKISVALLAEDMATLIEKIGSGPVDVMGYSLGGSVALRLAVDRPDLVAHLVVMSSPYRRDGWYPEVLEAASSIKPEMFRGSPIESTYNDLAPEPQDFEAFVRRVAAIEDSDQDLSEEQIEAIEAPSMIVLGDADGLSPTHAAKFFELRGGGDRQAAAMGYGEDMPRARLMILPSTTHIDITTKADRIVPQVAAFLDDEPYAGFPEQ
jgi:pimeloyl-ACP methyl ester carboxylesterase